MASMTLEEFFNKYVAIVEDRLTELEAQQPVPEFRERLTDLKNAGAQQLRAFAQPLLNDVPPKLPSARTGACTYPVGDARFCLSNLTRDECDALGGNFDPEGTCPVETQW